ncbi:MAG: acetate kinase [Actinomycetia bacterium]|nr:acetate kinase [Actinomycetes bacterium]
MNVLVVNAGGITLELSVVDDSGNVVATREIDPWDGHETDAIAGFVADAPTIDAVGHRVVHGGTELTAPTLIDPHVEQLIEAASNLAPLHQDRILFGIHTTERLLPGIPNVACFDTAFHTTMPEVASTYALPSAWRDRWPLHRLGFHGSSHAHVAAVAGSIAGAHRDQRRIVSCHLGSGASVCAILDGRSVDTTMGFTPLEGLVMVTRSGSVDPGLLLWLISGGGLGADEVEHGLYHDSGLVGLAGGSGDMREVVQRRDAGDEAAGLAFDVYIHRLRREISAMTASLGGIDILAFTGGVGQHMGRVRAAAADGLGYLGVAVDPSRNDVAQSDADVTADGATTACIVVTTGEAIEIAAATRRTVLATRA